MRRSQLLFVLIFSTLLTASAASAQTSVDARTRAVVAVFEKEKHSIKDKHGVRMEKYRKIASVAVVKANPADYSGKYEVPGLGFVLDITVAPNGTVTGSGIEPMDFAQEVMRKFTLRDGRVRGALFTATRVYADGRTQPLEGAFINETSYDSPTDKGTTLFGLGLIHPGIDGVGISLDRLFFEKR
jgi:hypothetical protein